MSPLAVGVIAALVAAGAMEAWAALLHRRAWHGPLWSVHRSHHVRRVGRFEANDALSALHAPIAIVLIVWGCQPPHDRARAAAVGIGVGMTFFGAAYVVVHDGFVHQRLPLRWLARLGYFARVARAHRVHHARGGPPYGFFAAPFVMGAVGVSRHGPPHARAEAPTGRAAPAASSEGPRGRPKGAAPTSPGGSA